MDELQPITQDGKESLGGIGATIVDSLDTLWLMGLKDDFSRCALIQSCHNLTLSDCRVMFTLDREALYLL